MEMKNRARMYERYGVPEREGVHKFEVFGSVCTSGRLRYKCIVSCGVAQTALLLSAMSRGYAPNGVSSKYKMSIDVSPSDTTSDRLHRGRGMS